MSARGPSAADLAIPPALRVAGSMMLPIRACRQPAGRAVPARVAREHLTFRARNSKQGRDRSARFLRYHDGYATNFCIDYKSRRCYRFASSLMERARPSTGLAKQGCKSPGAETRRGNERGCVKMVCCCPQAEERAGEIVRPARTRVRASRRMRARGALSCFETHRSAVLAVEGCGLASRCDVPQHEGRKATKPTIACTQTGALVTPTCACVGRTPIVSGLLLQ
jgi:hypothetical protein